MSKYEEIKSDMMAALKSHDKDTLSTIRLLKTAIDLYKINNKLDRDDVSDDIVFNITSKQVKIHKESIEEFRKANRDDLADKIEKEIKIISKYLPVQLSEEEVRKEIDKIFEETNATDKSSLGPVMKLAGERLRGKADMKLISEIVQSRLS